MRFRKFRIMFIAATLSVTAIFSGVGMTSMAAAPDPKEIVKDLTEYAFDKAIDAAPGGEVVQYFLHKGADYILGLIFGEEGGSKEEEPTIQDVLNKVDDVSAKIDQNHKDEMDLLKLIVKNIDSKDFRTEADSIGDDYKAIKAAIRRHEVNITTPGEGTIDATTYRAYKAILEDPTCDKDLLQQNFNKMKGYLAGKRSSTNFIPGYKLVSDYLMQKVLTEYRETKHDWATSPDFLEIVEHINGEISSMQANVVTDALLILAINNMDYKVREYEIANGIYELEEGEKSYASFENYAKDIIDSLAVMDDMYHQAIDANNDDHDFVQATVELSDAVEGKKVKGFHSFTEAWAQASSTNKDFTINGYQDVKSDKTNGYNINKLDETKYGYTAKPCGLCVKDGRTVTVDMNGHTFDSTASNKTQEVFGLKENSRLNLKNAKIVGGDYGVFVKECNNVIAKLENVTIKNTRDSAVYYRAEWTKGNEIHMKNCTVSGCQNTAIDIRAKGRSANENLYHLDGCTFENNKGRGNGGALSSWAMDDRNVIENCKFINNQAKGYGGALWVGLANTKNCLFEGNRSAWDKKVMGNWYGKGAGGAIYAIHVVCDNTEFKNNSTNDQAGAIMVATTMDDTVDWNTTNYMLLTNCKFSGNNAPNVGGAIRLFYMGRTETQYIRNCSFDGNNRSTRGGDVFVEGATQDFQNKLMNGWGNSGSKNFYTYKTVK